MQKHNKQKKEWVNIRITEDMKFWLMSEKAKRQLITYDQVLREIKEEQNGTTNANGD